MSEVEAIAQLKDFLDEYQEQDRTSALVLQSYLEQYCEVCRDTIVAEVNNRRQSSRN